MAEAEKGARRLVIEGQAYHHPPFALVGHISDVTHRRRRGKIDTAQHPASKPPTLPFSLPPPLSTYLRLPQRVGFFLGFTDLAPSYLRLSFCLYLPPSFLTSLPSALFASSPLRLSPPLPAIPRGLFTGKISLYSFLAFRVSREFYFRVSREEFSFPLVAFSNAAFFSTSSPLPLLLCQRFSFSDFETILVRKGRHALSLSALQSICLPWFSLLRSSLQIESRRRQAYLPWAFYSVFYSDTSCSCYEYGTTLDMVGTH